MLAEIDCFLCSGRSEYVGYKSLVVCLALASEEYEAPEKIMDEILLDERELKIYVSQ